ncbi:MAG: universal stress protein [Aeromicrobium sp.]
MTPQATDPIVVGVDGLQPAVLDYAATEARRTGHPIRLVRAFPRPASPRGSPYGMDISESMQAGGRRVLAAAAAHLTAAGVTTPIECSLVPGHPPHVLEDASRHAAAVVVGQDEARPWYLHMFEGRVAQHVAGTTFSPLVIVPPTWRRSDGPRRVVVMVEDGNGADGPRSYAVEVAHGHDASLSVVQVVDHRLTRDDPHVSHLDGSVAAWFERLPSLRGTYGTVTGLPAELVGGVVDDETLLVLAKPHVRRILAFVATSFARQIAADTPCVVAVIPSDYRWPPP